MPNPPASLAEALAQLQTSLPAIGKDKTAKVQTKTGGSYSYDYANLATISARILPLMGPLGLSFVTRPTLREEGQFVLAYDLMHASGQNLAGYYPLPTHGTPQEIGSAITYARRYCLCAVTGVAPDEDDDDGMAAQQQAARKGKREPPPMRPFDQLPRNHDGTLSRSRCTAAELEKYGAMNDQQTRAHNKLERDLLGTDSKGKLRNPPDSDHLPDTPPEDPWYDHEPLRVPQPAPPARNAIFGHFNRLAGAEPFTDEQRYGAMSTITGRKITSTNDLTAAEGVEVLRFLSKPRNHDALVEALAVKAGEATDA